MHAWERRESKVNGWSCSYCSWLYPAKWKFDGNPILLKKKNKRKKKKIKNTTHFQLSILLFVPKFLWEELKGTRASHTKLCFVGLIQGKPKKV